MIRSVQQNDQIGIIGVGAMGLPIVGFLAKAGFTVICADLNDDNLRQAVERGGQAATSLADLAGCRVVLVFVPTDDDVRSVAAQYAQFAIATDPVFVIHTSAQSGTCRQLHAELGAAGIHVVDAALTGGVRGANDGSISLMVGGDDEVVEAVRPAFAPWTSHVNHLGPIGSGQIGKTVNNMIHWGEIVAIVEALSLSNELGVDASRMREALKVGTTDSRTLRELEDMKFTWYEKDTDNAIATAAEVGREIGFTEVVRRYMRDITVENVDAMLTGGGRVELTGRQAEPHPKRERARSAQP
jgi:3-hydroxyisobutyrate dehydrogenase-like beta-hydroxyacid dehydrogenase